MSKAKIICGVDIGGTKCALTIGESAGGSIKVLDKVKFETPKRDPEGTVAHFFAELDERFGKYGVEAIGISCGGPLDSKKGVILSPPGLPGWDGVHIVEKFRERYGVPCAVQNDANACALAEWRYGAGKGSENMVFLTFGTGLGAGIIIGGRLYSGTNDMAGEVGHIRLESYGPVGYGKSGSFEGFCSGSGIAELGRMKAKELMQMGKRASYCPDGDLAAVNAKVIADCADAGHEDALEIYRTSGEYLGRGLSVLIDILNPEVIVIGSVFARSESLLRPSMERVLNRESLSQSLGVCSVRPAALGESVGDFAAIAVGESTINA